MPIFKTLKICFYTILNLKIGIFYILFSLLIKQLYLYNGFQLIKSDFGHYFLIIGTER